MAGLLDKFSVLGIITYQLYAISDSVEQKLIKNSTISFIDTFISSNVEKLNTLTQPHNCTQTHHHIWIPLVRQFRLNSGKEQLMKSI
jgi:hypothetical protein